MDFMHIFLYELYGNCLIGQLQPRAAGTLLRLWLRARGHLTVANTQMRQPQRYQPGAPAVKVGCASDNISAVVQSVRKMRNPAKSKAHPTAPSTMPEAQQTKTIGLSIDNRLVLSIRVLDWLLRDILDLFGTSSVPGEWWSALPVR